MAHTFSQLALAAMHLLPYITAGLAANIAARPALQPSFDLEKMAKNLSQTLPKQDFKVSVWSQGWLPANCKSEVDVHRQAYSDFKVFEVTYEDCRAPWVFCVQNNTTQSISEIFSTFGQLPVGLRSLMSNLIAYNKQTDSPPGYTFGSTLGIADGWWNPGVLAHELNHALDNQVCNDKLLGKSSPVTQGCPSSSNGGGGGGDFSSSSLWRDAQQQDKVVPTGYAATSLGEDFAEIGRVSLTNRNMPGGLAALNANTAQFAGQLALYERSFAGWIYPQGGRCVDKVKSSPAVAVSAKMRVRQMMLGAAGGAGRPDVSLPEGVRERVVRRDGEGGRRVEDWFGLEQGQGKRKRDEGSRRVEDWFDRKL